MANFYKDNPDLRFHMEHADWARLAPLLELGFGTDDPEAPSGLDDYLETNGMVLELAGACWCAEHARRCPSRRSPSRLPPTRAGCCQSSLARLQTRRSSS